MPTILTREEANALVVGALTRSKTSPENAAAVARALVGAELAGQAGHGLRRLASYCDQALAGKVDGFARPVVERIKPGSVAIDAGHGFAFPALEAAVDVLPYPIASTIRVSERATTTPSCEYPTG